MKRLTIRNSDGSVSQPADLRWADALELLADYEDTGLTPLEISRSIEMLDTFVKFNRESKYPKMLDWLMKTAKASCEGRLFILPCQFGDVVYRIVIHPAKPQASYGRKKEVKFIRCVTVTPLNMIDVMKHFGETVFLTREEAENAMQGVSDVDRE